MHTQYHALSSKHPASFKKANQAQIEQLQMQRILLINYWLA